MVFRLLNTEWAELRGERRQRFEGLASHLRAEYDRQHTQWRKHGRYTVEVAFDPPAIDEHLAALLDPCGANTLELDQEQEQEQVQKHVQKEESPVHDAYESEDVPEFSADQMQAFIDFTISNLVKNEACKGLTEEYFAKAAKKLKDIYSERGDERYSKLQVRRLMLLTASRCAEVLPAP